MCGIAGWCYGSKDRGQLERMLKAIEHRGPESLGIYESEAVSLGHARLAIVDVEGGQQPIGNEDETVWIMCNGEIYNHVELRERLEGQGHCFRTYSDTEVMVHLYEEEGIEGVREVNGQYAFVIWDSRKRCVFLCRDRVGIHPLFYTEVGGCWYFASEIKGLLTVPLVRVEMDVEKLGVVWTMWSLPIGGTCFRGIYEVPAGHYGVIEEGKRELELRRYWELDFRPNGLTEEEGREAVEEILGDAVGLRLQADVPVVAYLSGGLDSSLITALARRRTGKLETFSIEFEEEGYDESEYQRRVSEYIGSRHHMLRCDKEVLASAMPKMVYHAEVPQLRAGPIAMLLLSEYVKGCGYKVVVTGEGADELFLGYDLFKETAVRRFMAREPEALWRRRVVQRLYGYMSRRVERERGLEFALQAGLEQVGDHFFSHALRWDKASRLHHYFLPEVRERFVKGVMLGELRGLLPGGFGGWGWMEKAQTLEIMTFLTSYLLSSQGDRASMAHGVEGRYPFLDHRLIECVNGMPVSYKLRNLREDKHVLREVARGYLPEEIRCRGKVPYRTPMRSIVKAQASSGYIGEVLSEGVLREVGLFVPGSVKKLLEKVKGSEHVSEMDEMALCGIVTTQLWYQCFIKGESW